VVEFVSRNNLSPIFLSIGLGLGYIEIMTVSFYLANNSSALEHPLFYIQSFEKEKIFISLLKKYFKQEKIPINFKKCYDKIIDLNSNFFSIEKKLLINTINKLIARKKLIFYNEFSEISVVKFPASGIFFDAFSAQSTPDIWHESVLKNILNSKNCNQESAFATYASRISLKKILKENIFILHKKRGFAGKRECIFAERF
jgi:hypothetical protein